MITSALVLVLAIVVAVIFVGLRLQRDKFAADNFDDPLELQRKKYETARMDYEAALDDLEAEDCKQNRILALKKGREYCAISREYAHGDAAVTAVDEQMITNDINARTCD